MFVDGIAIHVAGPLLPRKEGSPVRNCSRRGVKVPLPDVLRRPVGHEELVVRCVPMQTVGYAQAVTHPVDAAVGIEAEEHSLALLGFEELGIVEYTDPEATVGVTRAVVGAESDGVLSTICPPC